MKPSRELVIKKLNEYWSKNVDEILFQLDSYKDKDSSKEGLARVQLAVIKLSRGNREDLIKYIEIAKQDCRDVLAYAEYPKQMKTNHLNHFNMSKEEQKESKAILKSDREQYMAWLADKGKNEP